MQKYCGVRFHLFLSKGNNKIYSFICITIYCKQIKVYIPWKKKTNVWDGRLVYDYIPRIFDR